ncbi:MAG: hypothetical protein ACYCU7_00965 [Acidimicrobiales bacterium]
MSTRRLLPFLLLGALSLLAAGGLVLGLVEAPAAAELAVHNATGETLAAGSFTADLTASQSTLASPASLHFSGRLEYSKPDTVRIVRLGPAVAGPSSVTFTGARAAGYLSALTDLGRFSHFRQHGPTYTASLPVSRFVPAVEARLVHGSYQVAVTIGGNRVTALAERVVLITPTGTTRETLRYVFRQIDGQPVVQPT